jgi:hypothetical protein
MSPVEPPKDGYKASGLSKGSQKRSITGVQWPSSSLSDAGNGGPTVLGARALGLRGLSVRHAMTARV